MVVNLRSDEQQWLRYAPAEIVPVMRAAEAWSLRVGGAFLSRKAELLPAGTRESAHRIGSILRDVSDARLDYLGSGRYDVPLESLAAASSFDVLSRVFAGEQVAPGVVAQALDTIEAALVHLDRRTRDAGFLHPTRLESVVMRGDADGR